MHLSTIRLPGDIKRVFVGQLSRDKPNAEDAPPTQKILLHQIMAKILPFLKDQDGFLNAQVNLKVWQGFLSRSGFNSPKGDQTDYTNGDVAIRIFAEEDEFLAPLPYQEKAIQYLIDNQAEIQNRMLTQLTSEFPSIAEIYDYLDIEDNVLPSAPKMEDFHRMIRLTVLYIMREEKEDYAYVGYGFGCTWDSEHGLGIMTHKSRVIEIGGSDSAFARVNDPEAV